MVVIISERPSFLMWKNVDFSGLANSFFASFLIESRRVMSWVEFRLLMFETYGGAAVIVLRQMF